ncbi:MAG TPA: hypothetical protein VN962_24975 [Polyangia bacterium]|nr:hypothetical protein [Polyangia bacterium]
MSKDCPSSFALDAYRLGLDRTPAAHVAGCARCTAWLAAQEQVEAKVAHLWVPAPSPPRRRNFWRFTRLGLHLATVTTAVLLLVARRRVPTETAKGPAALVQVARSRAGAVSWLSPADDLTAEDAIRIFVNRPDAADRYVLVGSVDGSGALARFYPVDGQGCSVPLPPAGQPLDGSIVIDEAPGPERLVILVSHDPLCWPSVGDAVRRFAVGAPLPADLLSQDVHATKLVVPKRAGAAP